MDYRIPPLNLALNPLKLRHHADPLQIPALAQNPAALDQVLAPRPAHRVVHAERALDVGVGRDALVGQQGGQHRGVLDAHAGARAVVRRGGVGGVAEEADAAAGVGGGRVVAEVEDGPLRGVSCAVSSSWWEGERPYDVEVWLGEAEELLHVWAEVSEVPQSVFAMRRSR